MYDGEDAATTKKLVAALIEHGESIKYNPNSEADIEKVADAIYPKAGHKRHPVTFPLKGAHRTALEYGKFVMYSQMWKYLVFLFIHLIIVRLNIDLRLG